MNTPNDEADRFEQRAKAEFDASVELLDGRTRSALTSVRSVLMTFSAALAEAEKSNRLGRWQIWGPVSGVAAAAFVLVVMLTPAWQARQQSESGSPFDDMDIIADTEDLEMLENLDFYAWLDSAEPLPNDG